MSTENTQKLKEYTRVQNRMKKIYTESMIHYLPNTIKYCRP